MSVRKEHPVTVVFAADERYAMPLAAAVRSVLDNLRPGRSVHVHIVDCGLSEGTVARLDASWDRRPGQRVLREKAPARLIEGLPMWGCYGASVYYRLFLPEILPCDTRRAIYLDSDVLVFGDLSALFDQDLDGWPLAAVRDAGIPIARERGSHDERLGLAADSPYFNSGVLLVNLDLWRKRGIGRQVVDCVRDKQPWIRWPDQDALNATLKGRWLELPPRWNAFLGYLRPRCRPRCPMVAARYAEIDGLPDIAHFVAIHKPWEPECDLFARKLFFEYLDRTAWKGWRPALTARPRPFPPGVVTVAAAACVWRTNATASARDR